ncbi:hypothetical protein V2A60_004232 [Cordyceps javanica]
MSAALVRQGVTVGGAVNTVYLVSRASTHDTEFFLPHPDDSRHRALTVAARHTNRRTGGILCAEWFNNAAQLPLGAANQSKLASVAFEQNVVVYDNTSSAGGLRLYAAPWPYAISAQLGRISTRRCRAHDMRTQPATSDRICTWNVNAPSAPDGTWPVGVYFCIS